MCASWRACRPNGSRCMQAETSKYVWDATEAARRILRFTQAKSLDDYVADDLLRAADVDDQIVWGVVIGPLPAMLAALEAL